MTHVRRLIVAIVCLAAFDRFVPGLLRRAERHRYEDTASFRFESSDLFGLGPLVSYLREHPHADRPRTLFLGNSVMFGFGLKAEEAVPARFQERHLETQVFNAAINGFDLGSNYLVASATIQAVDRIYVMTGTEAVNPLLASLIPVNVYAALQFHLDPPNATEARLQSLVGPWQLYASTYRLQAAWFGTSTREYIHRHTRPAVATTSASGDGVVDVTRLQSAVPPGAERQAELRRLAPLLWQFGDLVSHSPKRVVFIQIGAPPSESGAAGGIADFNAAHAPFAEVVTLTIPPALMYDGRHLTPIGARRVAEALP